MHFGDMNIALCLVLMVGMGRELPAGLSFPESHWPLDPLVPTARLDHSVLLLVPFVIKPCYLIWRTET